MPLAGGEFTGNITVENITPDGDSSRNIGTDSTRFANGYFDTLYGDGSNLTGIQGIPSGVIMLWSGAQNAIPSGFVLCNGSNSTPDLRDRFVVGAGNSFQGLYISNGMIVHDNTLNGNHYIGTSMNGLMAGPVTINGVLTVEGNYVVV